MNIKCFDCDYTAGELYNPDNIGAVSISGFLSESVREDLLREIKNCQNSFTVAPREYLNALQEFDHLYLGEADEKKTEGDFPWIFCLRDFYAGFYRKLSRYAGFSAGSLNSIEIKRYPKDSLGLTPHMDQSAFVNLISVFVLEGEAPFYIYGQDRKTVLSELDSSPGSLILLRAPRNRQERDLRPMHGVGRVTQERYTITFREQSLL